MSLLELSDITRENFAISTVDGDGPVRIAFSGNADMDAHVALGAFLRQLEREAARKQVVQVTCDFRQLYFMNSACFKCFVVWINAIAGLTRELQYVVEFVTNSNMHWQRRSLENLQYFGRSIVRISAQT